jgi:hypothetical protein
MFELLTCALAAHRANTAYHSELVGRHLRARVAKFDRVVVDDDGVVDVAATDRRRFWASGARCRDCTGFWLAVVATVLWKSRYTRWVVQGFATATVVSWCAQWLWAKPAEPGEPVQGS